LHCPCSEENIADAFKCTLENFMEMYELKQRANMTPGMSPEEKKVFVDLVPPAAFPYACQVDPNPRFYSLLPYGLDLYNPRLYSCEVDPNPDSIAPDLLEFKQPPYSIDLAKIFG